MGGFHWGDDIIFDSNDGGLDPDAGFKLSTAMLKGIVEEDVLGKCGFKGREVVVLGFGQGGMAALSLAGRSCSTDAVLLRPATDACVVAIHQLPKSIKEEAELGGIISIGGALPAEAPAALVNKCKTPILVCAGSSDSIVTPSVEEKLKHVFESVEVKRYRRPGDSMPRNRDEMMPIMQFFARRLRSRKGVPEGSVEIG